ncbi:hypothetical protein V511_11925 [Mesotoga sp. Brook.08.YT.4.2.5.1]|nr:hypothetical protein V511_11925 [Mesotoga sp. Brook.08.YT.4.2.5.1]PVD18161.1 hypothetical protein V512_014935 [Mesotoga sp. Brook.08.105.5.1]RAM58352.1 hypothetical protein DS65_02255 [Mesotoga sp. SC_4PWL113PWK15]RAO96496.1 hypothetical protein M388_13930 [Mesotoga sp. Brook.08.YT.4.2.5.4.]RDI93646.1 hypothetical protein Q502_04115 [Mesotoga sp. Brook.08.YT.4.2.5.2.]
MTVNVVFISAQPSAALFCLPSGSMLYPAYSLQRVLAPKRTAIFRSRILNHFGMTTGYSLYPHSILSTFSLMTIHENDGILDEEPRTWTRSVGTKNRSSRITGPRSGTKNEFSSEDGGPMAVDLRGFVRSSITSRRSRPRLSLFSCN